MTIYFIGAGIGGVEYLTVKAQQILQQAQVILYDALVDESLLNISPVDCIKISVGKRGGKTSTAQSHINQLLVEYGQKYDRVIRLKSGDVGIFGRIHEELDCVQSHHLDYQLLPGISSALAAPLLAGIMLTHKDDSRSVSIISGHNPDVLDWASLSRLDTLVILMGGRNLAIIIQKLLQFDRKIDDSITVIKNGGRNNQQVWQGTLENIVSLTANISLSPCIIIIGKIVEYQY